MNDPVLNRAMFRPAVAPMSSYGTGIASNVASPDEAARALQTAFQPTGYAEGGPVSRNKQYRLPRELAFPEGAGQGDKESVLDYGDFDNQSLGDPNRSYVLPSDLANLRGHITPSVKAPEQAIVPRRYGTIRSGFYRAGEDSSDNTTMSADPNFDLPPSEEWNPESQFGRDVKGLLPEKITDEEAKARMRAMSDEIKRKRQMMENVDTVRNAPELQTAPGSRIGDYFRNLTPEQLAAREAARAKETADRQAAARALNENLPPAAGGIVAVPTRDAEASKKAAAAAAARFDAGVSSTNEAPSPAAPAAPPPADKAAGEKKPEEESGLGKRLSLRIDELKQEREANKAQRRENQLLALMQAGFQAAAGKSSSALTNIAAGGASGIATLADLEKTRRSEDATLRKEALELELAKEKMAESSAERKSQREMLAAQRQQSLLQNVTVNARQEISGINSTIASEEAKLLNPAITEDQKAPIRAEIARLKNQRDVAAQQLYDVYGQMGLRRSMTPEQQQPAAGFNYLGPKK